MSEGVVTLQAQVESVLGALVKAATIELTKLFESRYGASVLDAGRDDCERKNETSQTLASLSADTKRSIGVQVDQDVYSLPEVCGPPVLSDGECLKEHRGEEEELIVKGCNVPSETFMAEDDSLEDELDLSPLKQQDTAETVGTVALEPESPADQTEIVLHVSTGSWKETLKYDPPQSSRTKQKPLIIQPDTGNMFSGETVKFDCPLLLKPDSPAPKPDGAEKPVQAEPQQASVSTAKGTAYSPSLSDGAVTPAQVRVWERVHTPKDTSNLHIKLKLTSPDQKLLRPCSVQLVDVLKVESAMKLQDNAAKGRDGAPLPKDLRRHQGLHTGHRLCCYSPCGDGVWQLQKVVTHTRDGYVCSICGKAFKRRKILRRHERFHTGEKPYPCSACPKAFALRKSLRRHTRFHTGERPHTCTHCSKSFRLRENLKAHLRFHTGDKPYSCTTCGKTFRIMRNLENHHCLFFVPSFRKIAGL